MLKEYFSLYQYSQLTVKATWRLDSSGVIHKEKDVRPEEEDNLDRQKTVKRLRPCLKTHFMEAACVETEGRPPTLNRVTKVKSISSFFMVNAHIPCLKWTNINSDKTH